MVLAGVAPVREARNTVDASGGKTFQLILHLRAERAKPNGPGTVPGRRYKLMRKKSATAVKRSAFTLQSSRGCTLAMPTSALPWASRIVISLRAASSAGACSTRP